MFHLKSGMNVGEHRQWRTEGGGVQIRRFVPGGTLEGAANKEKREKEKQEEKEERQC